MNKSQRKAKRARAKYHSLGKVKRVMLELGIPSCALLNNEPSFMGQIIPLRQTWHDESSLDEFQQVLAKTLMNSPEPQTQIQINERPVGGDWLFDHAGAGISVEAADLLNPMLQTLQEQLREGLSRGHASVRNLFISTPNNKPSFFEEMIKKKDRDEYRKRALGDWSIEENEKG